MNETGTLKPWAQTPFELLRHAEEHRRSGTDFDRRIALVSFDNSIEVSVITYLSLNPIQRGGRQFERATVENWMRNFHTKLEFLEFFANELHIPMDVERTALVFYHGLRNDLYHAGNGMVPAEDHLLGIRRGAVWAFSLLFECDSQALLDAHLGAAEPPSAPPESKMRTAVAMSDATMFLQAFLSVKEVAKNLLELRGNAADVSNLPAAVRAADEFTNLQGDPAPREQFESLAKAEHAKDLILQGETPDSETPLGPLSDELDSLAIRLKATLRQYQLEIAMSAMRATLAAKTGNRRAGVVSQPSGSGLSVSLLAYLSLCTQHPQLRTLRYIVLVDRRPLAEQFSQRYRDLMEPDTQQKLRLPGGRAELTHVLEASSPDVVVTTVQQLSALTETFVEDCVVIGYDLHSTARRIAARFPRGIYISFSSGTLGSAKSWEDHEIFGDAIYNYGFRNAARDGLFLPVQLLTHVLDTISDDESERRGQWQPFSWSALQCIARTVIRDATIRTSEYVGKTVILVPDLDSGTRIIAVIDQLQSEQLNETNSTAAFHAVMFDSTSNHDTSKILERFRNSGSPDVLVMTSARLAGLDLPMVDRCYVTCAIPTVARISVFSLVGRHQPSKTAAHIHDFGGNDWRCVFDEDLEETAIAR
ncbi:DEAD/DEAH box helicase [Paraburkholderia megapolitana]|uniref:DEAD/DEAH box helicase n=1 Tax=Paraburkholderia megapolitana TaxID=420953 RepID=UPI0038B949B5